MSYLSRSPLLLFPSTIPRPPRSTLFPTRRSSDLLLPGRARAVVKCGVGDSPRRFLHAGFARKNRRGESPTRSEEHTSELQSRFDLVCRLLLEKKNQPTDPKLSRPEGVPAGERPRV